MISNYDSIAKNKLHLGPRNAFYTFHGIQDELLQILFNKVVHTICQRVKEVGFFVSEFFSLLEALYVFVSSSKIHVLFMKKQHQYNPHKQPLELQKLSDVVNAVCQTYDSLILALMNTRKQLKQEVYTTKSNLFPLL